LVRTAGRRGSGPLARNKAEAEAMDVSLEDLGLDSATRHPLVYVRIGHQKISAGSITRGCAIDRSRCAQGEGDDEQEKLRPIVVIRRGSVRRPPRCRTPSLAFFVGKGAHGARGKQARNTPSRQRQTAFGCDPASVRGAGLAGGLLADSAQLRREERVALERQNWRGREKSLGGGNTR